MISGVYDSVTWRQVGQVKINPAKFCSLQSPLYIFLSFSFVEFLGFPGGGDAKQTPDDSRSRRGRQHAPPPALPDGEWRGGKFDLFATDVTVRGWRPCGPADPPRRPLRAPPQTIVSMYDFPVL